MNKAVFVFIIFLAHLILAQNDSSINNVLIISNDIGEQQELSFGLMPSATDGIDLTLGEQTLPPLPPTAVFDARFNLLNGESTLKDYRNGDNKFKGDIDFEIQYQVGTGNSIIIAWDFPNNISGNLQDIITGQLIDVKIAGKGSYTVTNPSAFNKLKMKISFDPSMTGVFQRSSIPPFFDISQNYPNPFNPSTMFKITIPEKTWARILIFNTQGQIIEELLNSELSEGVHFVRWNGSRFSSGTYFCQLESKVHKISKKIILLK